MVGLSEFESPTSTMSTWRSNQLSYGPELDGDSTDNCFVCKYLARELR